MKHTHDTGKRVISTGSIRARGTANIIVAMRPFPQILAEVRQRGDERWCSTVTAAPGTIGLPAHVGMAFVDDTDVVAVYEEADEDLENW